MSNVFLVNYTFTYLYNINIKDIINVYIHIYL